MKIGLIGFGGVGKSLIRLICEERQDMEVVYIVKSNGALVNESGIDLESVLVMEHQIYNHPAWKPLTSFYDVVDIPVDYVVELTPTVMEDGEPALSYIKEALLYKRNVITGNKGPILHAYHELMELARKQEVTLGIGCVAGGALPSIAVGKYGLAGSKIKSIEAILNGTTNFILSSMEEHDISYEDALKEAISLGITETDPTFDVEGFDTAIKIVILANALMNQSLTLKDVSIKGITKITKEEMIAAKRESKSCKLVGKITMMEDKVVAEVAPMFLKSGHPLFCVKDKNKGICYHSDTLGTIVVTGGASGTRSAAAAILRDM